MSKAVVTLNDIADFIKEGNVLALKSALLNTNNLNINQLCQKFDGMAPLHYAAYIGDAEIMDLLLSLHNVNVNFPDADGNTALHFASVMDKIEAIHLLLNSNAQVHLVNSAGKSSLDYAKSSEVKVLLENKLAEELNHATNADKKKLAEIRDNLPKSVEELKALVIELTLDHHNFEQVTKDALLRLLEEKFVAHHHLRLMEQASGIDDPEVAGNFLNQLSYLEDENEIQTAEIADLRMQIKMLEQNLREQNESFTRNLQSAIEQYNESLQQLLGHNDEHSKVLNEYQDKLTKEMELTKKLRGEIAELKAQMIKSHSKLNLIEFLDEIPSEIEKKNKETDDLAQRTQHITEEKLAIAEQVKNLGRLKIHSKIVSAEMNSKMDIDKANRDEEDESSGTLVFYKGENGAKQIKAATPDKLIDRLTDGNYFNSQFVPAFLLTYRDFIEKKYLLGKLISRFGEASNENPSSPNPAMLKICNILKFWVENYWFDFDGDAAMLSEINSFSQQLSQDNPKLGGIISSALNRKISQIEPSYERKPVNSPKPILPKNIRRVSSIESMSALNSPPDRSLFQTINAKSDQSRNGIPSWSGLSFMKQPSSGKEGSVEIKLKFSDIDPLELARQLTLIEHRLFTAIKAWLKEDKEKKAPNICKMTQWSNHVVHWVVTEIVSHVDNAKNRAIIYERFVQLASHLEKMNNFNGLKEILAGLQSSAVYRLKKTRMMVPSKYLRLQDELNKLTSSDLNFKALRARIHVCDPPLIPFPGVYQGDLVFLDTGSRTRIEGGLINFQKCQKFMSYISELQTYQQSFYHLEPVFEITEYIKTYKVLSDEDAYSNSLICEPRSQQ